MLMEKRLNFRMEEEEDGREIFHQKPIGFHQQNKEIQNQHNNVRQIIPIEIGKAIEALSKEREEILKNDKISPRLKRKLLESNRKTLIVMSGGIIRKPTMLFMVF